MSVQTLEDRIEQVTKSSSTVSPVGNSTELKVDWSEVGLAVLEVGILEGAVGGKIGLNKALSNCGT